MTHRSNGRRSVTCAASRPEKSCIGRPLSRHHAKDESSPMFQRTPEAERDSIHGSQISSAFAHPLCALFRVGGGRRTFGRTATGSVWQAGIARPLRRPLKPCGWSGEGPEKSRDGIAVKRQSPACCCWSARSASDRAGRWVDLPPSNRLRHRPSIRAQSPSPRTRRPTRASRRHRQRVAADARARSPWLKLSMISPLGHSRRRPGQARRRRPGCHPCSGPAGKANWNRWKCERRPKAEGRFRFVTPSLRRVTPLRAYLGVFTPAWRSHRGRGSARCRGLWSCTSRQPKTITIEGPDGQPIRGARVSPLRDHSSRQRGTSTCPYSLAEPWRS